MNKLNLDPVASVKLPIAMFNAMVSKMDDKTLAAWIRDFSNALAMDDGSEIFAERLINEARGFRENAREQTKERVKKYRNQQRKNKSQDNEEIDHATGEILQSTSSEDEDHLPEEVLEGIVSVQVATGAYHNEKVPHDMGEVYDFAQENNISDTTARSFVEINNKQNWIVRGKRMKNWRGALVEFAKKDRT